MTSEKQYVVSGPVAVIKTQDGSERYVYRGAVVSESVFTAESIEHNLSVGLLAESDELAESLSGEDEKPADSWNHERIDAWAAAQQPPLVFTGESLTKAQKLEQITAASK